MFTQQIGWPQEYTPDVFRNPDDYLAFDPEDLKHLVFYRFYYSESDEYWSSVFQSKSEQDSGGKVCHL